VKQVLKNVNHGATKVKRNCKKSTFRALEIAVEIKMSNREGRRVLRRGRKEIYFKPGLEEKKTRKIMIKNNDWTQVF
jgi:hypothetical protein